MGWTTVCLIGVGIVGGIGLIVAGVWKPIRKRWRAKTASHAVSVFRFQREQLEARFFDMAASLGKPRGLRWVECEWLPPVTFARDLTSGLLTAFVSVQIRFEAIEGGDMEDVDAVGMVRDASALFHFSQGRWGTGGRALFNMSPRDALERLDGQFEPVSGETTVVSAR